MASLTSPDRPVRDLVAQADRHRRARAVVRRIRASAPIVAGAALLIGLLGRFVLGWPAWIGVLALAAGGAAIAAYAYAALMVRPTNDAIAMAVDADAELAGELRSAHWFEAQDSHDDWATFHLNRATERATGINWPALYPRDTSPRPWIATAILALAVVGFGVRMPAREKVPDTGANVDGSGLPAGIPIDLQQKLAALLAQLDQAIATRDPNAKEVSLAEMKDLMAKMDPAMQKKIEDMLAKRGATAEAKKGDSTKGPESRPDRAENATAGLPEDVKWALDNQAAKMAESSAAQKPGENAQAGKSKSGDQQGGAQQQGQQADAAAEKSAPLMRESAGDQNGKMIMGGGGPMGGDSRPGQGAGNDAAKGAAEALLVAKALRKEMVEANADALGENVDKEDLRRKTEQGKSSLGFTRVAPPGSFEPSRASAPPPVPEARRSLLFNYFIRKR